jgi:hypothetical protein
VVVDGQRIDDEISIRRDEVVWCLFVRERMKRYDEKVVNKKIKGRKWWWSDCSRDLIKYENCG